MNLPNYLDFGNYQANYFSGGTLSPGSELGDPDNFTDGTVIVLTDGPMMAYYTIRAVSPAAIPIIKVDGKSMPRLAPGVVTADVFTDLPAGSSAKLLIAAYQNGKLLSVQVTDVAGGFGKTSGIYGTLSQTDGVTVKAFLLQALDNPSPLTENAALD